MLGIKSGPEMLRRTDGWYEWGFGTMATDWLGNDADDFISRLVSLYVVMLAHTVIKFSH